MSGKNMVITGVVIYIGYRFFVNYKAKSGGYVPPVTVPPSVESDNQQSQTDWWTNPYMD